MMCVTAVVMFFFRNQLCSRFRCSSVGLCRSYSKAKQTILRNEAIPHNEIRLVMTDPNGKSISQIMSKSEALKMGLTQKLDLILGMRD